MRMNLKMFRIKRHMSQEEIASKIGCTRATYSAVESGSRDGRQTFWQSLQFAFALPDDEMWELMKREEE